MQSQLNASHSKDSRKPIGKPFDAILLFLAHRSFRQARVEVKRLALLSCRQDDIGHGPRHAFHRTNLPNNFSSDPVLADFTLRIKLSSPVT